MKHLKLFEYFTNDESGYIAEILKGYLTAALWTNEELDEYTINQISESSIISAKEDIKNFLDKLEEGGLLLNLNAESIGHNFWLTRNGHGAGFWDKNLGELGDKVSEICKEFGEKYTYVGDDKKIYIE